MTKDLLVIYQVVMTIITTYEGSGKAAIVVALAVINPPGQASREQKPPPLAVFRIRWFLVSWSQSHQGMNA
jgi:hypothetical protein